MSDLIPILAGGAIALVGSVGTEWLRDGRATAREQLARSEAREQQREDFQRATLIELQDSLQRYIRGIGAAVHFDEMSFRKHGEQFQLPHGLSDQIHEAQMLTSKLATRVMDDEVRDLVDGAIKKGIDATLPGDQPPAAVREMGELAGRAQERMGTMIRGL